MKLIQPNSKECFGCGMKNIYGLKMRFYNTSSTEVISDYTVAEQFQGYPGVVHGGVIAAMLDEITTRAYMGLNTNRFMFTARLNIRYRKNIPVGKPLHLVGKVEKSKSRTATAVGKIFSSEGELLAEAEALLVNVPNELLASSDLDALGWRVYPENGSVPN